VLGDLPFFPAPTDSQQQGRVEVSDLWHEEGIL